MQGYKPGFAWERKVIDNDKITISEVPSKSGDGANICIMFKNAFPGTRQPDRYQIMTAENWDIVRRNLDVIGEGLGKLESEKAKRAEERKALGANIVASVRAMAGLSAAAQIAAARQTLAEQGFQDKEIEELLKV